MPDILNKDASPLFVVGTDTGIGKTVLSLLLMQAFYKKGRTPFYIKPFQTGCRDPYDTDSDAKFIYTHVPQLRDKDPAGSVVYCYPNPKAPYFAGRDEGRAIDMDPVARMVSEKARSHAPLIIEAAGGLLVPVTRDLLVIDVVKEMAARPVLAARTGLGTINHTLLSLEAMKTRGIAPAGVIFIESGEAPAPAQAVQENMEAIEAVSGIRVAGVIPHMSDFSNPGPESVRAAEHLIEQVS